MGASTLAVLFQQLDTEIKKEHSSWEPLKVGQKVKKNNRQTEGEM